jgi:hypothetical protein
VGLALALPAVVLAYAAGISTTSAAPLPDAGSEAAFASSPLERDLDRLLPGVLETEGFVARFRPGTASETQAPAIARAATAALEELRETLELKTIGKLPLYVYGSSAEMSRLTGRTADGADAIGHALHVPVDAPDIHAAVAHLLEPWWGRTAGFVGGSLEEGRWYQLKVEVRGTRLTIRLDDGAGFSGTIDPRAGRLGFGIAEGRLAVKDMKVRPLPAEPEAEPTAPWVRPGIEPEVQGRWRRTGDELVVAHYGRMTRARLALPALQSFELHTQLRLAAGARAELFMHEAGGSANRLVVAPGALLLNGRPAVGPHPVLHEGFGEAYAARKSGRPLQQEARALLERELLVDVNQLRFGLPRSATQREHRKIQAAAMVHYLWERFGIEQYRRLHFDTLLGSTTALGTLESLDAAWREQLRALSMEREEFEQAVRALGLDVIDPARAWQELPAKLGTGGMLPRGGGTWRLVRGRYVYAAPIGDKVGYIVAPVGAPARMGIAATVRFDAATRIKISVRGVDKRKTSVVVSAEGATLVADDGSVPGRSRVPLSTGRDHDIALVLADGAGRVYLDGRLAAEAQAGLTRGPGRFAIEVDGPEASVRSVRVRELEP